MFRCKHYEGVPVPIEGARYASRLTYAHALGEGVFLLCGDCSKTALRMLDDVMGVDPKESSEKREALS